MFLLVVALATGFFFAIIYVSVLVAAVFYVATGFAWRAFELQRFGDLCSPIMRSPFGALFWPLRLPIATLGALVQSRRPTRYVVMADWMTPETWHKYPTWDAALEVAQRLARERHAEFVSIRDYAWPGILYRVSGDGNFERRNPRRDLKKMLGKEGTRRLWPY